MQPSFPLMAPRTPKNHVPDPVASEDGDDDFDGPSKTQLKKDMHELQALGEAFAALPESRIVGLPISETLIGAVMELSLIHI